MPGPVIFVTGVSRGIGRAMAEQLDGGYLAQGLSN
jgi:NAD(P)-dependent dehydrogenase (short-subunit alcohol dehydrogenase family)